MSPVDAHVSAFSAAFVAQHEDCAPLDEVIAAYLASLRASGYVVVPMEPTAKMVGAVVAYHSEATGIAYEVDFVAGAIRAALSAAPKFPPGAPDA